MHEDELIVEDATFDEVELNLGEAFYKGEPVGTEAAFDKVELKLDEVFTSHFVFPNV